MFSSLVLPADGHGAGLAFTDRADGVTPGALGSLNLGRTDADEVSRVERNGELVREAIGADVLVALHQVHGATVQLVDEDFLAGWGDRGWDRRSWLGEPAGRPPLPEADAAVTMLPGVALVVRAADCVPVLLADTAGGVVGAAHAGRAGFDRGVLAATVDAMRRLGAGSLRAWIGPHVCGQCYEVPQEMADEVAARHPGVASVTSWGTPSLDLGAGCARQLATLGVEVHRVDPCTLTTATLHSHRRDGANAGRQAGIIWRVSPPGNARTTHVVR